MGIGGTDSLEVGITWDFEIFEISILSCRCGSHFRFRSFINFQKDGPWSFLYYMGKCIFGKKLGYLPLKMHLRVMKRVLLCD